MKLPRVRQASVAAGRRSGNGSRLPLPEPILAAVVMTLAWEGTSNGHNVILQSGLVGSTCLSAVRVHAYLRPGELTRIYWDWVTSDWNGNPDHAAIVLHPVEESPGQWNTM